MKGRIFWQIRGKFAALLGSGGFIPAVPVSVHSVFCCAHESVCSLEQHPAGPKRKGFYGLKSANNLLLLNTSHLPLTLYSIPYFKANDLVVSWSGCWWCWCWRDFWLGSLLLQNVIYAQITISLSSVHIRWCVTAEQEISAWCRHHNALSWSEFRCVILHSCF